jgi:hypothetical protein
VQGLFVAHPFVDPINIILPDQQLQKGVSERMESEHKTLWGYGCSWTRRRRKISYFELLKFRGKTFDMTLMI